eukprot:3197568-Amphidinium_carterae.1
MTPTDVYSLGMSNTDNNEHQIARAGLERLTQIIGEPPKFVLNLPFGGIAQVGTHSHGVFSVHLAAGPRTPFSVWGTSRIEPLPCPKVLTFI